MMPPQTPPADSERPPAPPHRLGPGYEPPSVLAEKERRSHRLLMIVMRLLFMVMLVTVTVLTIASTRDPTAPEEFDLSTVLGLFLAAIAVGVIVLVVDAKTPNKRLTSIVGVYLGFCVGLIGALAIGALIDVVSEAWGLSTGVTGTYVGMVKVIIGIVLCYFAVSIVLTTKDDFRLVIPYVEFSKQVRGVRPMLLDTSVLIDGRVESLGQTGFIDAPLVLPQFVIDELQTLADLGDKLKRGRGRRGLSVVSKLQANPFVDLTIDNTASSGHSVDHMLLEVARERSLRILTTDYNLEKVAQIQGVAVLNINELANTLKAQVVPGETFPIEIVKQGESPDQGVGYMPDGTMVVVEHAASLVGRTITIIVTNSLQTSAGRMIFGRVMLESEQHDPEASAEAVRHMTQEATNQPRATEKPPRRTVTAESRRNPRR